MIWINLLLLIGFSVLLVKATDILITSLQQLAKMTRWGKFTLTTLVLALATSLPELVVSLTAAFDGRQNIALGTLIGSNIVDISLVIGGAALIGGSFSVAGEFLKIDLLSVFLAGSMPFFLLLDKQLSRFDGLILLVIYGFYAVNLLRRRGVIRERSSSRLLQPVNLTNRRLDKQLLWLVVGIGLLLLSAEMIIKTSVALATTLGTPVFLISLFLIAIGTSLPELTFEMEAVRKKQIGMALGDLFGSIIVNSTLILGLTALINPIKLSGSVNEYGMAVGAFGLLFILFWQLSKTKKKLERWEGVLLIIAYLIFAWLEWGQR